MAYTPLLALALLVAPTALAAAPDPLTLPQDTRVEIEFLTTISSASAHRGEIFTFRLSAPITYRGKVVIPAGAQGQGEVIEAKPAKGSGVAGVLILAPRYIDADGQRIPLYRLQQDEVGQDRVGRQSSSVWASRFSVLPTTLLAMTQSGGNIMVPQGGRALAQVARDTPITPIAQAPATPEPRAITPLPASAELSVPAPPKGKGQVVFFRPGTLMWMGIGCTVSEEGRKLSSLGSGKWFAALVEPGIHAYTVTGETKDSLRLNIEEGETQYVACRMRASVLVARPTIQPVESRIFHIQLSELKPVSDGDMADPAVLRRDTIRYALAERGDVRGPSANGASRGDTTGTAALDRPTQTVAGAAAANLARETGIGIN